MSGPHGRGSVLCALQKKPGRESVTSMKLNPKELAIKRGRQALLVLLMSIILVWMQI
jgi:hypothetical protein